MKLAQEHRNALEELSGKIATELVLAESGRDDGLIPCFSLLGELLERTTGSASVQEAASFAQKVLGDHLDAGKPWNDASLTILTEFNFWAESVVVACDHGTPVPAFSHAEKAAPANAAPSASPAPRALDTKTAGPARTPMAAAIPSELLELDVPQAIDLEENRELLGEFHAEAVDHLGQIENALLQLEGDPSDSDAINSIFRSFHTLKGVAGFLHLKLINRLAHEVESLLDLVRNGKLALHRGIVDVVLEGRDVIEKLVAQVSEALNYDRQPSTAIPISQLILAVRAIAAGSPAPAEAPGASPTPAPATEEYESEEAPPSPPVADTADPLEDDVAAAITPKSKAKAPQAGNGAGAAAQRKSETNTIRVHTFKLDNLMDMVGELVILQSQLVEAAKVNGLESNTLSRTVSQLGRISKELQHTTMSLRMIPIKPTFHKMARLVRDLAAKAGKQVTFTMHGEDTELDRNVVEEIGDPLVHMIRNALDHGVEPPADRVKAGKPATGHITINAYHKGSNIVIELSDNGRGIDTARVLRKAIERGLVDENQTFSDAEIFQFIFLPGFSTAEKITDISGRGVGMDVVKRNIERLRGSVEIQSHLGKGSTFKILLPLTMAIIDGLVVRVGPERYILPTTSVRLAMRPRKDQLATIQGRAEVMMFRDKTIPVVRLHRHLAPNLPDTEIADGTVVIVDAYGKSCGLLVDEMVSKQEVVIKSLGSTMRDVPGVAGGAILGDGNIALILDPSTLLKAV